MKYITVVLGLLLITGCVHSSTTSAPINIVGLWKGTIDKVDSGPPLELVFNFVSDGQNIGGFMRDEALSADWIRLENFIMKGNKIYFTTSIDTPQGKINHKYRGRLVDSEIKLAAKVIRPGSSGNPLRGTKPSFRYEGTSRVIQYKSNNIDQSNPDNMVDTSGGKVIQGMKGIGDVEFTIRKVQ